MEFFDRKEDVIDIQVTPLGKRLMQLGQFKPKFYAFYDNDIIYDGNYAGLTEAQNDIQERIKETPRVKQQVYAYSAEGKINSNTTDDDLMSYDENLFQNNGLTGPQTLSGQYNLQKQDPRQADFEMFGPLGKMSFHATDAPSWNIDFFEATLTGSTSISYGNNSERIPNLECNSQYKFKLNKINPLILDDPRNNELLFRLEDEVFITTTPITSDGSFLRVEPDPVFLKVTENNTDFLNDNFDIEISRIDSDGIEQQLYFDPAGETVYAGTPLSVEYWFELLVDSEIPDAEYCKQIRAEKLESTYTDKFIFDCDDLVNENIAIDQIYEIPDNEPEICD